MGVIGIILLIAFVIICILLVGIVLIQRESGDGLGGLFGSGNSAAFGSRSQTVITKTTYVLTALFFVTTFVLAFLNKAPAVADLDKAAGQTQAAETTGTGGAYWLDSQASEQTAPEAQQATDGK
ncbi:preprotein translocase, SecG subunit [Treponema maltophilum ATCC 51939]|uniref:Protein-export membrane protein SecG n=1 Tax=Treponema maltophilum ATCC 51939 TaxID=1125699 RepID=S3L5D6_TREMA|nr:preprotein translocase subunit SecG [Treponema maltophilum]EPF32009.1 preprotein translocase, SecG subunit [Treponema maltophilum ATCC 51939]